MASAFMSRLDPPSTGSIHTRVESLINNHGDPQKVFRWRQLTLHGFIAEFSEASWQYIAHKNALTALLGPLHAHRALNNLPPIQEHPLVEIRARQIKDFSDCFRVPPEQMLQKGPSLEDLLETMIKNGALTRDRIIGALLIIESATGGIVAEMAALNGRWWKPNGSWDVDQGDIRDIISCLKRKV